jgi:hypothetical protein
MIPAQEANRNARTIRYKTAATYSGTPFLKRKSVRFGEALLGGIIVLIVIVQLLYPWGEGLPYSKVGDVSVGLKSSTDIAKIVQDQFEKTQIKLAVGTDKIMEANLKSAGAEPNVDNIVTKTTNYPLWLRLMPGSIFWSSENVEIADVFYTTTQLEAFSEEQSKALTFPPQNARLEIKDGKLTASEAVSGSVVKSAELLQAISTASIQLGKTTIIQAPAIRQAAMRTTKDFAKVRDKAEAALNHTVTIQVDSQKFLPNKKEIASWIVLSTDQEGRVALSVDKDKIKHYISGINEKVGTPAGQTNIEIVDGREVGRTTGSLGRSINADALSDQIAAAILVPPPMITKTAEFIAVQPSVIFNNKYTTTQAGLQAYINDVARDKNMHIYIEQLDAPHWTVSARADESIPSGSTYKLFVALVLFDKMQKGEIHWEDPMLDTTVAGCFERMTVPSTNPCAEKWIADFGRQYINDFIHARGFSEGTSFTTGSAIQTTAVDLTKYMKGLNDGTLVGGQYRERLLDSLGRHPYRYGIPTGSAGVVHDKVGFLWDYVHDTAIIQHPRGTYLMTIMTKGQGYAAIAAVTRQVERIMYP